METPLAASKEAERPVSSALASSGLLGRPQREGQRTFPNAELSRLAESFERHLRAEDTSSRTVQTYGEG